MASIGLISSGIIVVMALLYDADGTARLITVAITIRGIVWLVKQVTGSINLRASQLIDFGGWSMAGVSLIGVIQNAMGSVNTIKQVGTNIGKIISKIAEIADKIVFWN